MALLVARRNATLPSRANPFPPPNVAFCSADTFKFTAAAAPRPLKARPKSYDEPLREKSVTILHCAGAGGGRETTETERISHLSVSRARETEKRHPLVWEEGRKGGRRERKRKEKKRQKSVFTPFCIDRGGRRTAVNLAAACWSFAMQTRQAADHVNCFAFKITSIPALQMFCILGVPGRQICV